MKSHLSFQKVDSYIVHIDLKELEMVYLFVHYVLECGRSKKLV